MDLFGKLRKYIGDGLNNLTQAIHQPITNPVVNNVNNTLGNVITGIRNTPVLGDLAFLPQDVANNSYNTAVSAGNQILSGRPSTLPIVGTKIPAYAAVPAKFGMSLLNLLPASQASNLISTGVRSSASAVPGLKNTPIPQVLGFGAGLVNPRSLSLASDLKSGIPLANNQLGFAQIPGEANNTENALKNIASDVTQAPFDFKQSFANWVNNLKAIGAEKQVVKNQFSHYKDLGQDPFFQIQAGSPNFTDVRDFLNKKYNQATSAGFDFPYQQNYLTQVWNNTPEEIAQAFGSKLSNKPGFTVQKAIEDYKTGIEAGLTPKYNNLPDLLAHYEGAVNKAVADRTFINDLMKNSLLAPTDGAPPDWKTINPDRFPRIKYNLGSSQESFQPGPFKAPAQLADMINNHLYNPMEGNGFQKGLAKTADFVSGVKNRALSFGIPGTAVNAHGLNILARHTIAGTGGNPFSRFATGAKSLVAPGNINLEEAPKAIKSGLTLSVEDHQVLPNEATLRSKFGDGWNKLFEKPLFDKMIPNLKLSSWKALASDYAKTMPQDVADREAAKLVNTVYGGINWEQIGRSKDFQNMLRTLILAPDWAESNIKLGKGIAKSFIPGQGGPSASRYRSLSATLLGSYVAANVANKLSSGHYMYENDPGHTFEVEAGYTSDGQKRYVRPYGTAFDAFRVPFDTVNSLSKGDLTGPAKTLRNRLSIPAGVGVGYLTDTDYRGKPIGWKGKDQYGQDMPLNQRLGGVAGEVAQFFGLPSFIKQGIDTATGKQGVEQGLTQGLELPFRYSGGAFSKSQKLVQGVGQSEGLKGKDLYDLNQQVAGNSFSKDQQAIIRQGGTQTAKDLLQIKKLNQQFNDQKNSLQSGSSGKKQSDSGVTPALAADGSLSASESALLSLAKQKIKLGINLSSQEQDVLNKSQKPQLQEAQYQLAADEAKRAKDQNALNQTTQSYIDYLNGYKNSLNPNYDQPEILRVQKKINDLQDNLGKSIKKGKGITNAKKANTFLSGVRSGITKIKTNKTPLLKTISSGVKNTPQKGLTISHPTYKPLVLPKLEKSISKVSPKKHLQLIYR